MSARACESPEPGRAANFSFWRDQDQPLAYRRPLSGTRLTFAHDRNGRKAAEHRSAASLIALAQRNPNAASLLDHLKASHTTADDVGRIATAAGVKTLVLNHFVPADDKALTQQVWRDAVATTFSGPIIVGRDLLTIPLS